ncbi:Male sterility protein [Desulfonatronum thiosulfatophilum]|uniref:Male sterility protein n=1 Tax=Desulfonatronum thiosulfatophilum TaxID=617002 RepID=A0A1G6E8D5_9BACT|nr:SDR family oxidoreductase [Desulfonatronum thiosulfatophilum]SDB53744.1 Male sterility protein [Desulfonatronum thiosulfatophilum]
MTTEPRTILVTGGTGLLGSHIAVRLLADGHRILLLARGRPRQSARVRVDNLLDWFGVPQSLRSKLKVLDGNLDHPGLDLHGRDRQMVTEEAEETIHCASDTSFSTRKRQHVERTNIRGLEHLLDVLQGGACRGFHLISTAYTAGKRSGSCPEDFAPAVAFHNVYEETKHRAEHLAKLRCAQNRIVLTVHRPSIVYGDSVTGRTFLFNALYYPVRTLHFFSKLYGRDIREQDGAKARAMGVTMDPDETLHLPLRIAGSESHGINLIPVDHFIRAFMAIRADAPQGGVFHIVNPDNITIGRLVDYTRRFFRLKGLRTAVPDDFIDSPRNGLELLFENHIQAYGSYMQDNRIFENAKSEAILHRHGITCPAFTYDVFATCMRYAVDVDWGRSPEPHAAIRTDGKRQPFSPETQPDEARNEVAAGYRNA